MMTAPDKMILDNLFNEAYNATPQNKPRALLSLVEELVECDSFTISAYANKVYAYGMATKGEFKAELKRLQDLRNQKSSNGNLPSDIDLYVDWSLAHSDTKFGLGDFRRYTDGIYVAVNPLVIKLEMLEVLIEAQSKGIKPTNFKADSLVEIAKADLYVPDDEWDSREDYLPCKNGLLHLPTLTLHEHNPELLFTSGLDYNFDPEADCPVFKKVLAQAVPGAASFLQEFAGYCLTTDTSYETAVWLYGLPGGGKSTIIAALKAMLGPRAGVLNLADIERNQFGLAKLPGKTLMVSNEQPGNRTLVTDTLNSLISGEPVNINRKFREVIEITPMAKILWAMNEMPRLYSANNGLLRRVKVIQVPTLPEGALDTTFKEKVKLEAPGILNWALEGLARLRQRGYFDPAREVLDATNNFKEMVDISALFISEQCDRGSEYSEQSSNLYGAYRNWCDKNGYECLTQTAITEEWKRLGFTKYTAAGRHRWKGVKLIER